MASAREQVAILQNYLATNPSDAVRAQNMLESVQEDIRIITTALQATSTSSTSPNRSLAEQIEELDQYLLSTAGLLSPAEVQELQERIGLLQAQQLTNQSDIQPRQHEAAESRFKTAEELLISLSCDKYSGLLGQERAQQALQRPDLEAHFFTTLAQARATHSPQLSAYVEGLRKHVVKTDAYLKGLQGGRAYRPHNSRTEYLLPLFSTCPSFYALGYLAGLCGY
jgi:hypothetical protein